jgi:opacity protein-like surface antigen
MKRSVLVLALAAVLASAAGGLRAAEASEKAAEASARAWLGTVDAAKYGESWGQAAALFRAAITRPQWEAALEKVRRPLGKILSRKLRGAKFMTELPNAPAGEYVVIQYDTDFENGPGKTETITPMKEKDGGWRVSGYYIK